ncbi:MAG: hypothetical protein FWG36_10255 [Oscillospiraceae bacterium]|nr:hypothetical protein [Oscillospiraceae bacterium]
MLLKTEKLKGYTDRFNADSGESTIVDGMTVYEWLGKNVPLFECPDKELEEVYYFRWWVYGKHIKHTPDGYVITEFLPDVPWAGRHNTIACAAGHHIHEGRWLADSRYIEDYIMFWYKKGGDIRAYSNWIGSSVWDYCAVKGDFTLAIELLGDFIGDYREWERTNLHDSGLFWSSDDRDGMEFSISGSGLRPTLNSYMYAYADTIAKISKIAGKQAVFEEFTEKSQRLRRLINKRLWNPESEFYKVIPLDSRDSPICKISDVRELLGYTPWYFNIPDSGMDEAWRLLTDSRFFYAPYGPTTAEQSHPGFMSPHNHECLWNGPSWPFATSVTLTAMLNSRSPSVRNSFNNILNIYSKCHIRTESNGRSARWLDENIDPFTGEWLSRSILENWGWPREKGGFERGMNYNHSTYCDLIITGLAGLRPREDDTVDVQPLIPDSWDYFCIDPISYHGHSVSILYDRTGERYGCGKGLFVRINGKDV